MKKFCVVTNVDKDKGYTAARQLKSFLESKGRECILVKDRFLGDETVEFIDYRQIPGDTDCIIILGGDGTLIQAAIDMHQFKVPFLGINMGTLGFLTEIETENLERDLTRLLNGEGKIERRLLLDGRIFHSGGVEKKLALNDFVISKTGACRLITLRVYVNDEWIDTYVADGLIISSPTGSTGYNLSAGGPVLTPEVPAMIITPICPHSLNNRSLVVSSQDKIKVVIGQSKEGTEDETIVYPDGSSSYKLSTGDWIEIGQAENKIQLIRLKDLSLLSRLRQKLGRES